MFRQAAEDENCHYVTAADGTLIPIAKAGLSEATLARIAAKAERAAEASESGEGLAYGGAVEGLLADGGEVEELDGGAPAFDPPAVDGLDAGAPLLGASEGAFDPYAQPSAPPPNEPSWLARAAQPLTDLLAGVPSNVRAIPIARPGDIPATAPVESLGFYPPRPEPRPEPVAVEPVAPAPSAPPPAPGGGAGPPVRIHGAARIREPTFDAGPIDRAIEAQKAGAAEVARIEAEGLRAKGDRELAFAGELEVLGKKHLEDVAANKARLEADQKRIAEANGVVEDPGRFWRNATTGQRLQMSIGLMFGGLNNYAMQSIQRSIDDDLVAQRAAIEGGQRTAQGLLALHVGQGKDLETAYTLAKADALSIATAQLGGIASVFGGQEATAKMQQLAGELDQEGITLRQAGQEQALDRMLKLAQAQHLANEDAYKRQELALKASAEASGASQLEALALQGHPMPPDANAALSPAVRNVMARMPDGTSRAATGVIGKQAVEAASGAYADASTNLDAYEAIRAKWPNGWLLGLQPGEAKQDEAAAKALYEKIRFGVARMNEPVGMLTEADLERAGAFVPDITASSITFDTKERRLAELRNVLKGRMQSIYDAHLVRPGATAAGPIAFTTN